MWGEERPYKWMGFGEKETHPVYKGQVKDGKPNGLGIINYPNRNKYVGSWKNGKYSQGTFTWSNGSKYVGKWKDGLRNGQGTEIRIDGYKYVGEWKDGWKNGQGTETRSDGGYYVGEWKNGRENGQGTYTHHHGGKFVGEYKDSQKWNGTSYEKDGTFYGRIENGRYIFLTEEEIKILYPKLSSKTNQ